MLPPTREVRQLQSVQRFTHRSGRHNLYELLLKSACAYHSPKRMNLIPGTPESSGALVEDALTADLLWRLQNR